QVGLLALHRNPIALVARSIAVGVRSSSAAPASANASAPSWSCVCKLMYRDPSSASTETPTMTTSITVTYGRMMPSVSPQNALIRLCDALTHEPGSPLFLAIALILIPDEPV